MPIISSTWGQLVSNRENPPHREKKGRKKQCSWLAVQLRSIWSVWEHHVYLETWEDCFCYILEPNTCVLGIIRKIHIVLPQTKTQKKYSTSKCCLVWRWFFFHGIVDYDLYGLYAVRLPELWLRHIGPGGGLQGPRVNWSSEREVEVGWAASEKAERQEGMGVPVGSGGLLWLLGVIGQREMGACVYWLAMFMQHFTDIGEGLRPGPVEDTRSWSTVQPSVILGPRLMNLSSG